VDELDEFAARLIQYIEANGANLNQDTQQALGELLQNILAAIEEEENPIDGLAPIPEGEPPLNPSMASSNINSFGYDEKTGRLLVKFQGDYPQENGPIYAYSGVPPDIFQAFRMGAIPARTNGSNAWGQWWRGKSPSVGASFYNLIRQGGYPYQQVS